MDPKIKLEGFQLAACNTIELLTEEMAAKLSVEWPPSKADVLAALIDAGLKKGKATTNAAKDVWDLRPTTVDVQATASTSVNVTATLTTPAPPENKWTSIIAGLHADGRMEDYAADMALDDRDREVLVRIGLARGMVLLDQSGIRAAILAVCKVTDDGTSERELPLGLADNLFSWYNAVTNGDSNIMKPDQRDKFGVESNEIVHADLESMLYAAVKAKTGKSDLQALGEGSTFDVGSFGNLGPTAIASQITDVLNTSTSAARKTFVLQRYNFFAAEYDKFLYPIVESEDFQSLCGGVTYDPNNPRATVAQALLNAGHPLAAAAFRAIVDEQILWKLLSLCEPNPDVDFVLGLGELGIRVMRNNAQIERIAGGMKTKEVVAGAQANAANFRHADANIRAIALPKPPRGLQFLGLRILVTADAGVRITKD